MNRKLLYTAFNKQTNKKSVIPTKQKKEEEEINKIIVSGYHKSLSPKLYRKVYY